MVANQIVVGKKSRLLKKYLRLTGVIILCVILFKIDFTKAISILAQLNIPLFIFVVLLNIPQIFIKSFRWNQLLRKQSIHYDLKDSFLVYFSSVYVGILTPGRFGEFVKALYVKSGKDISLSRGMSSVLMDRLFDMYLLIILGGTGIWKFGILGKLSNAFVIVTIIVMLAPILMLNKKMMGKLLHPLYKLVFLKRVTDNIEEKFEDFYNGINQLINLNLLFSGLLTCLAYLVFFIQCYLIVIAMGISVNFITIAIFMSISSMISLIPISISGLGTRDAVLIYLFALIGFKPETAVSYSFLVFITFFVCGGLMGAIACWIRPLKFQEK